VGERFQRELVIVPLAAATVPALLLVGSSHGVVLVAAAGAFAFFNFMVQPSLNALIADYSSARLHGRVFGFTFLAGFGFGSFAGVSGGVIADRLGTPWVFIMLAGFGFLIAVVALALYGIRGPRGRRSLAA
jgi:sugar phosphate permease